MKTIYINSKILEEGVLKAALSNDIISACESNKTSFGKNQSFPEIYSESFTSKLCNKRYCEICDKLKAIGKIDIVRSDNLTDSLSELINMAIEIEKPFRQKLEKMCLNYIIDTFSVPDDMIEFNIELSDEINVNGHSFEVDRVDDDESELDSIEMAEELNAEVSKRRVINALCMGAGMDASSNLSPFLQDLYEINPRLPEIYRDILLLNDYLLFSKEDLDITDKNKKQLGSVNVKLGNIDKKVVIESQAKIFPVLICETVRGMMELFASHGLPEDKSLSHDILVRSDYLKAEPWDMRIGPELWKRIVKSIGSLDTTLLPYIFKRLCKLNTEDFNKVTRCVFAKTKKGATLMKAIVDIASEDKEEYSDNTIAKKTNPEKIVITDEFIHEEEL